MGRSRKPVPDWDYHSDFVIADEALHRDVVSGMDRAARKQWQEEHAPRWLAWDARPTKAQREAIRAVRVRVAHGARARALPSALRDLSSLAYLSMPLSLASALRPGDLPDSLEAIAFDESTGGRASLAPELVLPKVRSLASITGELTFVASNVPRLEEISLRLGARPTMLDVLAGCRRLSSVRLDPVHDLATLEPLVRLPLRSVAIVGGRLATLDGIDAFGALEELLLKNVKKLSKLSALSSLERLSSLELQYCGAVEDLRPILAIPRLKELRIVACSRIRLAEVVEELRARRWRALSVTGKRHLYESDGKWIVSTK
ncbi:MAG: hypothetical protein JST00_00650 [Deltaproteobacteria bacterium]|nr:hypothetical protein [Deltaproteobacteria bacterium]